ncbi:Polyketide cyclase / dehydrase and lipid transport [Caulobacter sp. AP07]|uniref:SRPBCC family protein n=1 Tax=Caulobacter sp. AP07 TaxID=1144304 RepID=UPI000271DE3B|nr:SRPBCC family protein [Caulobacter sp. AP07]EJL37828.1 Polyketide cyclase / dehydrase and lipid transport [Caulobacter sp. AP07]
MIKIIAIVVVVLIVALLGYAATRPNTFRITRSTVINAPSEKIFAQIQDFHRWGAWSPYEKLDPAMERTFSNPAAGVGATYGWNSKGKAGVGDMKITQTVASSKVALDLNFTKPFVAHNTVVFTLEPQAGATRVTWTMEGAAPYMHKLMGVFFNMDKMIGADFETGLASLKAQAEG